MKSVVTIIALLFANNTRCAPSENEEARIIGGFEVNKSDYPYVVSLRNANSHHFCGGTLIHQEYVVTAAHCVKGGHAKQVLVDTTSYKVLASHMHPEYSETLMRNDIAILQIERSDAFKSSFPHRLQSNLSYSDSPCYVLGWGLTEKGGKPSKELKMATVNLVTPAKCEEEWKEMYNSKVICTTSAKDAACHGDSGGPLICENYLAGVVSFGKPCGTGKPDVFTGVQWYNDWIDSIAV